MAEITPTKEKREVAQIKETDNSLDCLQENVVVAPYSLAILGQVMLLATKKDFSLISKPVPEGSDKVKFFEAKGDFKYITHPESFRATLVQVSNAGYRAFLAAHSNMDKIRLDCGNVQQHVELVTECIVEGDDEDVKTLVPVSLESMQSTANSCAEWSREIVTKFHTALELLEEVYCSCHASQMTNEDKIKELERRKTQLERLLLKKGIEQVAELEKQWKMLVLFFEGVANVVQVAMGGAIENFSKIIDKAIEKESLSRFTKKKIIELAFTAYSSCNGVSSVATSYLKISNDYLMPSIVELGTLLALDSEQDAEKIKQKTESIQLRCRDTVGYIKQVVKYAKVENANQVTTKSIEMK